MKAGGTGGVGSGGVLVLEMSNPNVLKYLKSFLDYTFIPFIFFRKFMFLLFTLIDKVLNISVVQQYTYVIWMFQSNTLGQISIPSVRHQQGWEDLQGGIRKWNGSVWPGKRMLWNYKS